MESFHLLSGATSEKGGGGVSSTGTEVALCFSFSIEVSGSVARPIVMQEIGFLHKHYRNGPIGAISQDTDIL